MLKVISSALALLLLSHQYSGCEALIDPFSPLSYVKGLDETVDWLKKIFIVEPKEESEFEARILEMNERMTNDIGEILGTISDFPDRTRMELTEHALEGHFAAIKQTFEEAVRLQWRIDRGQVSRENTNYENFHNGDRPVIKKAISEIRRILTQKNIGFTLQFKFQHYLEKFENVCRTGMSHLQLLNTLLDNIRIISSEYYTSVSLMWSFLELKGQNWQNETKNLLKDEKNEFKQVVQYFKRVMGSSHRELWKCDPKDRFKDLKRYDNDPNSTFVELTAFSNYLFNAISSCGNALFCSSSQCNKITEIEECYTAGTFKDELCVKTRKCPNKFISCDKNTNYKSNRIFSKVCVNKNASATARYSTIISYEETGMWWWKKLNPTGDIVCPDGDNKISETIRMRKEHDGCKCVCPENKYHIYLGESKSNISDNKVVTGARFRVENNIIYLDIQDGKLLTNGTIDRETVDWVKINETDRKQLHPIEWEGMRSAVLTKIEDKKDHVIIGAKLVVKDNKFHLALRRVKFDYATAKLNVGSTDDARGLEISPNPTAEYKLDDCGVPTKGLKKNEPHSTDDQFVKFTTTSLEKDGGQSTIPFIDVQEVATDPPVPLDNIQMYVRGQDGYGGFLGLRASTYDFRDHLYEDIEIRPYPKAKQGYSE